MFVLVAIQDRVFVLTASIIGKYRNHVLQTYVTQWNFLFQQLYSCTSCDMNKYKLIHLSATSSDVHCSDYKDIIKPFCVPEN